MHMDPKRVTREKNIYNPKIDIDHTLFLHIEMEMEEQKANRTRVKVEWKRVIMT